MNFCETPKLFNSFVSFLLTLVQSLRAVQDLSKKVELDNAEAASASADIADSHVKLLSAVQHLQVTLDACSMSIFL